MSLYVRKSANYTEISITISQFHLIFLESRFEIVSFELDILEQFVTEQPLLLELRFNTKPISKQIALRNQGKSQIHSSKRSSLRDSHEY